AYGADLKHAMGFADGMPIKQHLTALSKALAKLGIWVRLHYVYPYPHVDELLPLMADGAILPYLDIPFQHASPRILKLMRRPGRAEKLLEQIQAWRQICPQLVIRSTFIVGFPGETEEDFEQLLDWLQKAKLERVGCFAYSPVDGASANELADPVPEEIKQQRLERLMTLQQQISLEKLQQRIGSVMQVLIDEVDEEGAIGRTYADAPEIDGVVYLNGETLLTAGELVNVTITHADEYDLWGEVVA
ncbi:MAG: radical SAM protein, partial [Vibrionaceae bacterium]